MEKSTAIYSSSKMNFRESGTSQHANGRSKKGGQRQNKGVYSRPRVTAYARTHLALKINASKACDIWTGYDFTVKKVRDQATTIN